MCAVQNGQAAVMGGERKRFGRRYAVVQTRYHNGVAVEQAVISGHWFRWRALSAVTVYEAHETDARMHRPALLTCGDERVMMTYTYAVVSLPC